MYHTFLAKKDTGQSYTSVCTSSGRQMTAAPVSTGSVSTRIARGSETMSCSGRFTRSQNFETGRNASLHDTSGLVGSSSC